MPVAALATTVLAVGIAVLESDPGALPVVEDEVAFAAAQEVEILDDLEFLAWLEVDARAG
jgi:hypothetical protein